MCVSLCTLMPYKLAWNFLFRNVVCDEFKFLHQLTFLLAPDGIDPHYHKKRKSAAFCADCDDVISVCWVCILKKNSLYGDQQSWFFVFTGCLGSKI